LRPEVQEHKFSKARTVNAFESCEVNNQWLATFQQVAHFVGERRGFMTIYETAFTMQDDDVPARTDFHMECQNTVLHVR